MYLDSAKAVIPPLSGTNVPGQRTAQRLAGATAQVSRKMSHNHIYHLVTGPQAVRVTFRGDKELAAASGVSDSVDMLLPANVIYRFLAFEGQKNEDTGLPQYGSVYLYIVGDAGAAYEAFLYEASK